jgi:hypothetical protein
MTLVFDIDGTVMETKLLSDGRYKLLSYDREMIAGINTLFDKGHTIIIQTARHWNKFQMTRVQLSRIGIKYHSLVMGKPVADFYIDDKGLNPEEFMKLFNIKNGGRKNEQLKY